MQTPCGVEVVQYRAYLPHEPGSVPLEMDWRGYWSQEELARFV